jgi:hypothetical protein
VPDFDRDAFRRSVQDIRSSDPLRKRSETTRGTQPERAAISRQIHEETIETLEGALTEAGIDVSKLRLALARNQKRAVDAVAARRSRAAATSHPELTATTVTSGRFHSLRPLAGRAIPLNQPSSLTFLNEPFDITADDVGGNYLVSSSLAPTFVSTLIDASAEWQSGEYTFWYTWKNSSDSAALTQISTALEVFGTLFADVAAYFENADVDCYMDGGLNIGFGGRGKHLVVESRKYHFATLGANVTFWGLDQEWTNFDHREYGMSIDGFLVPPNTEIVISVWIGFTFNFGFGANIFIAASADFASNGGFVACPGVVVVASPVQTT